MNRIAAFFLAMTATIAVAQAAPQIRSGATVYIEPMDGYETYLAAAMTKKHVPMVLVTDRSKADYVITSTVSRLHRSSPAVVVNNTNNVNSGGNDSFDNGFNHAIQRAAARGATSASISVVDVHSTHIVFSYSVGKSGNTNQIQSAAEACAKHLKSFIEKQ